MISDKMAERVQQANAVRAKEKKTGRTILLPGYLQIIRAGGGTSVDEAILMPWDSRLPARGSA